MSTNTNETKKSNSMMDIRIHAQISMLGAVSAILLMIFEIPLWFAPGFYKIDLSEVPVLIGAFAIGPAAGAAIELVKLALYLIFKGTHTAGVGEFANFLIGCSIVMPAGIIYKKRKSKQGAFIGMGVGIVVMTVMGCLLNAFILLPVYAVAFGMPMDSLIGMGTTLNPAIDNLLTFTLFAVAPFNLIKGAVVLVVTFTLYKYISPILRLSDSE